MKHQRRDGELLKTIRLKQSTYDRVGELQDKGHETRDMVITRLLAVFDAAMQATKEAETLIQNKEVDNV